MPRPGELEEHALEGGEPRRVEVLDHLDDGGRVEAGEARVAVDQRAVEQLDAARAARSGRRSRCSRSLGASRARGARRPCPTISVELPVREQRREQLALAAAEVEHALRARCACSAASDGAEPLLVEADAALSSASSSAAVRLGLLVGIGWSSSTSRASASRDEAALVLQVAAGDQLALGVRREPALAVAQQLLDLVVADPVVLVVVEHRDEHVEVGEQVAQAARRRAASTVK